MVQTHFVTFPYIRCRESHEEIYAPFFFIIVCSFFLGRWGASCTSGYELTMQSPFYMPELRLMITESLLRTATVEEALRVLRAWSLVDRASWGLFKNNEERTLWFLNKLHECFLW